MTHRRTIVRALPAACLASAAIFAAPAAATPDDTHPTSASSEWGSGCFVHDANGTATFDPSCEYHLQLQLDTDGNLISAMYHDHTQAPAGAALPSSTLIRDISFDDVRCTERITPSGQYSSECYFQSRSQAYP
jgi:hypothetical protein